MVEKTDAHRREEFARRLRQERLNRNMNQSELARRTSEALGKEFGRHNISSYEKGNAIPSLHHLRAIASVLSVAPTVLVPDSDLDRKPADQPMVARGTRPGYTWLRIDQEVTIGQMVAIAQILNPNGN
jgi:transcriptional regulator with XRE-family HTH domain